MSTEIQAVASVAVSRGGDSHRIAVSALPESTTAPAIAKDTNAEAPPPPAVALKQALSQIERYLEANRSGLEFRVDRDLGRVIVSIVDPRDGTVLRQMPSEEVLRIARTLADEGDGGLLDALV